MRNLTLALITTALIAMASGQAMAGTAVTIDQVNQQMKELSGKEVVLHGEVTKVNNGIMRRNFIHITDADGGSLIVTSKDTAQVGQKVKVVGTVKLDTDFGMGYSYPLLIENSSISVE